MTRYLDLDLPLPELIEAPPAPPAWKVWRRRERKRALWDQRRVDDMHRTIGFIVVAAAAVPGLKESLVRKAVLEAFGQRTIGPNTAAIILAWHIRNPT